MNSGELANIMIALRKAEDHIVAAQKKTNKMFKHVKPGEMSNTLSTLQVAKVEIDKAIESFEKAISPNKPIVSLNPDDDDVYAGDEYGPYGEDDNDVWDWTETKRKR